MSVPSDSVPWQLSARIVNFSLCDIRHINCQYTFSLLHWQYTATCVTYLSFTDYSACISVPLDCCH